MLEKLSFHILNIYWLKNVSTNQNERKFVLVNLLIDCQLITRKLSHCSSKIDFESGGASVISKGGQEPLRKSKNFSNCI